MKKLIFCIILSGLFGILSAQAPQKISYQAVVRNAAAKLVQNSTVGLRLSILQGSPGGTAVYSEIHTPQTNVNGLVSVEIGTGISPGNISSVNWGSGPYFLKSEVDPAGGTSYSVTGVSELLSVPYSLNAATVGVNGFSGDYGQLTGKPVVDGSETKILGGGIVSVTGTGTQDSPYMISSTGSLPAKTVITSSQTWTVPPAVSKIRVELWGGAGGGGGAGAYSYSYNLNTGGTGGSGGFASQELSVAASQQFNIVIGIGGSSGSNAYYSGGGWYGDTNGGNGGDSWFGPLKAAGGTGGKKGSYYYYPVHGEAGTANVGDITGYASNPQSSMLDVFSGLLRSYLAERFHTSRPGIGGSLSGYSNPYPPAPGEAGCAVITFIE